jgi:hypothetical protein
MGRSGNSFLAHHGGSNGLLNGGRSIGMSSGAFGGRGGSSFLSHHGSSGFGSRGVGFGNSLASRGGLVRTGLGVNSFAGRYGGGFGNYRINNYYGNGGWRNGGYWGNRGFGYGFGYPYRYGFGYGYGGLLSGLLYGLGGYGWYPGYYGNYGYGGYGGYGYGGYGGYGGYSSWGYPTYGSSYSSYGMPVYTSAVSTVPVTLASTTPVTTSAATPSATNFTEQGETAFKAGNYSGAAYAWQHAVIDNPQSPVLVLMHAQALFATGKFAEAAGATQVAMSQLDKDQWGVVVTNYRELYGNSSDYTTQLRALEAAVRDKPNDPALRFLLGYHYTYLGYPQQGADQLATAVNLAPQDQLAKQLLEATKAKLPIPAAPVVPPAPSSRS